MNADLLLISKVKEKPELWDNCGDFRINIEKRIDAWNQISLDMEIKVDYVKKRWISLRERFVKELKHVSSGETNLKFEYFKEMTFLSKCIKFRRNPVTVYPHCVYRILNPLSTKNHPLPDSFIIILTEDILQMCQYKKGKKTFTKMKPKKSNENNESLIEFLISEEDLQDSNDDTDNNPDNLFVELSDSEEIEIRVSENEEITNHAILENDVTGMVPEKRFKTYSQDQESSKNIEKEQQPEVKEEQPKISMVKEPSCSCLKKHSLVANLCEDTIFGMAVTSMLKPMPIEQKKFLKRKIMELLLT